jgi:hypothetical protein
MVLAGGQGTGIPILMNDENISRLPASVLTELTRRKPRNSVCSSLPAVEAYELCGECEYFQWF